MKWFEQVSQHIDSNLKDFISHFFPESSQFDRNKAITLNPSPCCGHNDCFSIATHMNAGNCFSCGTKGTRIQIVEQVWGLEEGRKELEKWSGIQPANRREESEVEKVNREKERRLQKIYKLAVDFYHMQLMSGDPMAEQALEKQLGTDVLKGERSHNEETLKEFKVGLALNNFDKFKELMRKAHQFTDEELDAANKMIWVPPYYYVYPYFDKAGNVVRINTKPFMRRCLGKPKAGGGYTGGCGFETYDTSKKAKKEHESKTGHVMSGDGFSTGDKSEAYYTHPDKRKKKYAVLVEGENDALSVYEELQKIGDPYLRDIAVIGIGGGVEEGYFQSPYFRQFKNIYEAFDNDEGGDKYREQLNKEMPDVSVYRVSFDKDYDDIDQYLKYAEPRMSLGELIDRAELVESKHIHIEREGHITHKWHAKNRAFELVFEIDKYNFSNSQFDGTLSVFKNNQMTNKKSGGLDRISLKDGGGLDYARLQLSEHLTEYYHNSGWDKGKPARTFRELLDIMKYTKIYEKVVRQVAWYMHKAEPKEYQRLYQTLLQSVRDQKMVAQVLQEVNGYTNEEIDPNGLFPKISLSQFFHVNNNDGYFYYSRIIRDGSEPKVVPCLISNKKEEIRLDLLKRKDPQCLLLIQNKYEMPFEVETVVMDPIDVSLQPYWVEKWQKGEIDEKDLEPLQIIQEIEAFIRRCYYLEESTLKVLSLWIYATYFYMLFKSGFPYLMFTGPKGTGKSTLDTLVYLLSLNAKLALDMSESALYRTITFEGGTFILDEVEHLTDKRVVDSNGYAKILKGGYSDNAYVYKTNMDKGGATEKFSVFGPKVISNINGIEDVIADRCIFVRTFRVPEEKLRGLKDPQIYKEEERSFAHSITSRAALSSLVNFKKVSGLFHESNSNLETGNARLSQILRPLVAMARFVGGDYENHLMKFYETEVKQAKEEVSVGTVEGMVREVLTRIAEELVGLEKDTWATENLNDTRAYFHRVTYSHSTKTFEVDSLYVKVLCEELNGGISIDMKIINQTMKNIFGPGFNPKTHRKQTTATITDEGLQRAMNGKRQLRVYRYVLSAEDFIKPEKMDVVRFTETKPLF